MTCNVDILWVFAKLWSWTVYGKERSQTRAHTHAHARTYSHTHAFTLMLLKFM